jgi:hypothetical protein
MYLRRTPVTIIRSGATKKYASNWGTVFGKKSPGKKSPAKAANQAAKSPAKKTATKKKTAPAKSN